MKSSDKIEIKYRSLIWAVSIIVPGLVAVLFFAGKIEGIDTRFLPPVYATINAFTAVVLVVALIAIRKKNILLHKRLMVLAITLSVVFLVLYVVYHSTNDSTKYGGEGISRMIYFGVLLSHILLSIAIIPLVLITFVRALTERFDKHKRIARITYPIWLYVAVSGVVVYLMISPYYT